MKIYQVLILCILSGWYTFTNKIAYNTIANQKQIANASTEIYKHEISNNKKKKCKNNNRKLNK